MPHDSSTGRSAGAVPPGTTSGRRPLPASALAGLRDAFAGEVATRLPRLQGLNDDPAVRAQALRDAHALGSSSYVVGEAEAARCARALEADLLASEDAPLPATAHAHLLTLTVLLSPWLAA